MAVDGGWGVGYGKTVEPLRKMEALGERLLGNLNDYIPLLNGGRIGLGYVRPLLSSCFCSLIIVLIAANGTRFYTYLVFSGTPSRRAPPRLARFHIEFPAVPWTPQDLSFTDIFVLAGYTRLQETC